MAEPKLRGEMFWTDRWLSSSAYLLRIEARGLYREMLTRAWTLGGYLPAEPALIRKAIGCDEDEWERSWPKIKRYWTKTEDGTQIFNSTQLDVLGDAMKKAETRAEKAKKAAQARWNAPSNATSNAQASPKHMLEQCPPSPSPSLSKSLTPSPSPEEDNGVSSATPTQAGKPAENGRAADVRAVFDHFAAKARGKPRLTEKRKTLIARHLREGRTVEELCLAIDGLYLSRWHTDTGNLTIEYGLRNDEKIEKGQAIATDERHPDRLGVQMSEQTRRSLTALENFTRRHADDE